MPYPDLLVAFGAEVAPYRETNGHVASERGKPPDLVLEIAAEATGHVDVGGEAGVLRAVGDTGVLAMRSNR